MKKYLKIVALILALSLILGLGWFANAFLGNPISKMLAQNALEDYLTENYSDLDLNIERFGYSFKSGDYFANVQSKSSMDTNFYIYIDMLGNIQRDSYESLVLGKHNTYTRLWDEYKNLTETIFDSPNFPYVSDIAYGQLIFVENLDMLEYDYYPFYAMMDELELDKQYDIRKMGAEVGELIVYIQHEDVSAENAAKIILDIKAMFDEAGIPFKGMDFQLEYPKPTDDSPWRDGAIYSYFLYEEIYEEGMLERVKESHKQIEDYYAKLDAENAKLFEAAEKEK